MANQLCISFKNAYSDFTFTSEDPKGSKSSSQEIRGYISVMASMEFTYIFNERNNVL